MYKIFEKIKLLIKDGFFHILIGNVLVKMVGFLSSIFIVRLISKADYGYLAYADNLYQYINLLSGLGLSTAILKFCSPKREKGENKFFLNKAITIGILFQLTASVLLVFTICFREIPFPKSRKIIFVLILYPTITQIVTTIQSYIRAQLNNKLYAKIGVVQTLAVFIASLPLAYIWGIYGVVYARYFAMILVILIGIRFVKTDLPVSVVSSKVSAKEYRFFWKVSLSMMLANMFSMIMPINEMFLINNYIKDEIVSANYKVAILIPSQIVFLTSSVVVYLFPKLAQIADKLKDALKITVKVGTLLFGIIIALCSIGYVISPLIIRVVYGERYIDAIRLSKVYWIVYGLNAGFRMLPMNVLPAIGSTLFNSFISILSCIVHVCILRKLIISYGIYGAPYSLMIVYIISGCIYWFYLYIKCTNKN